ncbi:MAG: RNA polymerase sigma factor [Calditrichaceae bacterium]
MSESNDSILVKKCIKGDIKSFEILVDKYQKTIFNVVYRMIHRFDDAEDITQSVFIKVYENLRSFNPKYKFFSWIYRIALNETLNYLNQRKRIETLTEGMVSKGKTPDEIFEEWERNERIQEALMEVPYNYRILIILKHFQGCSYEEIAYIADIPEKKVKSRLFTARQMLKDVLLKYGMLQND